MTTNSNILLTASMKNEEIPHNAQRHQKTHSNRPPGSSSANAHHRQRVHRTTEDNVGNGSEVIDHYKLDILLTIRMQNEEIPHNAQRHQKSHSNRPPGSSGTNTHHRQRVHHTAEDNIGNGNNSEVINDYKLEYITDC
jgi:hypothetical protein